MVAYLQAVFFQDASWVIFGSGKLSIQKLHPKLHSRYVSHLTSQTGLKVQMSPSRTINISSSPLPPVISNFQLVKKGGGMAVKEATAQASCSVC